MAVDNNFAPGKTGAEYQPNTYAELGDMIGKIAYQVVAEQMSVEDVIKVVSSIIYGTADIEITQ